MKLAIMQPYFLPYLGYFQLINAVDRFVLLDDVNYIKKGYVNRNSFLTGTGIYTFTIPLIKASQNKLIKDIEIGFSKKDQLKLLKTMKGAYKKAPYFEPIFSLFEKILEYEELNISKYNLYSIQQICSYLGIATELVESSSNYPKEDLTGSDRILDIAKKNNAAQYLNPIGGLNLYEKEQFEKEGVVFNFIKMNELHYKQFNLEFTPNLSILDVLMFNSVEKVNQMLNEFTLV